MPRDTVAAVRVIFDSEGKGRIEESGSVDAAGNCSGGENACNSVAKSARPRECAKRNIKPARKGRPYIMESLILAQNERWRRVLSMQVGRQVG